jgi:protein SCO1/2
LKSNITVEQDKRRRINPWSIWIPVILMALGVAVFYNYLLYLKSLDDKGVADRPPFMGRAEGDLILTERDGRQVRLSELRGKVILAAWVFTRCPRGCAGVVARMREIWEENRDNPDLHFIAFALDPEDTPEMLAGFAEQLKIPADSPWWFVQSDNPDLLRGYMTRHLKFRPVQIMPEEDRLSEYDKFMHDLRVALIDHKGNVRRLADLVNADPELAEFEGQRLRRDLNYVLDEKRGARAAK